MIKIESNFDYGEEVKDSVTGVKGRIVAITKWKNGCIRIAIQSKIKEDGVIPEAVWLDEMDIVGFKPVSTSIKTGGPRIDSKRHDIGSSR